MVKRPPDEFFVPFTYEQERTQERVPWWTTLLIVLLGAIFMLVGLVPPRQVARSNQMD